MPALRYVSSPADVNASKPMKFGERLRATVRLNTDQVVTGQFINESGEHADLALDNGWELEGICKSNFIVA